MRRPDPRIAAAVLVLFGACGFAAYRIGVSGPAPLRPGAQAQLTRDDPAPELVGLSQWFNSAPTTIRSLRGKVVLVDFWTYTCINCIRTFPELRSFYATYHAAGLEILGIHSPEFNFEKDPANVARAVREKNVTWPVAMDNGMKTWQAYDNHYWPHVYVIDAKGHIRFDQIGEGGGPAIESVIRRLLKDAGATLPSIAPSHAEEASSGITPELYLGYERGGSFLGNDGGFVRDRVAAYRISDGSSSGSGLFFLAGRWRAGAEGTVASEAGARVVVPFTAKDVFVVAGGGGSAGEPVDVLLDGKPVPSASAGSDLRGSAVTLKGKDLYRLIHLPHVESHELTLRARRAGAVFYTFTFG